jgi:hypothetical protein
MEQNYLTNITEIFQEIKSSNTKLYVIIKHRQLFTAFFTICALLFGTVGFLLQGENIFAAIMNTFGLFGLNFPEDTQLNGVVATLSVVSIFIGAVSAVSAISFLAIIFFLRDFIEKTYIKKVVSQEHTLVFGLGEINRSYLNTLSNENLNILIIEQDPANKYIDEYKERGFALLIGEASSEFIQKKLNYETCQNAIIALGEDRYNIELAKYIITNYTASTELKIIVHIQNKDLEILFHTGFLKDEDEEKTKYIHIKTFSFYEEVAQHLFMQHSIDGDSFEYISTDKAFKTILLGDGVLLHKILFHIALISHLPKENKHTVYIVDKDAKKLMKEIEKVLYYRLEKESFPHLEILLVELDSDSLEFYTDPIWHDDALVNVIIGFNDEKENLDLAVELYNRVYLQKAKDAMKMPKILFGIFNEMLLSKIINENKDDFKNFFTYGNTNEILKHSNLVDEEGDLLGKLIHALYDEYLEKVTTNYDKNKLLNYSTNEDNRKKINSHWYKNATYNDKLSSIAQAKLIDLKLKALHLKRVKTTHKSIEELLKHNRELLDAQIDEEFDGDVTYSTDFDSTLFKNLIRMEHNRWNAYHYLNGFRYSKTKDKDKKLHNCLLPLKEFDTEIAKESIIFDIYSFMYLPNYLAEAGYELEPYEVK